MRTVLLLGIVSVGATFAAGLVAQSPVGVSGFGVRAVYGRDVESVLIHPLYDAPYMFGEHPGPSGRRCSATPSAPTA